MREFYVGKIVRAQGIKGEVKIKSSESDLRLVKNLKTFYIDGKPFAVKTFRSKDEFAFVLFSAVAGRNAAEALAGRDVYADEAGIEFGTGDYFVRDIVGCEARLSGGAVLGRITDVLQNGRSADVFVVGGGPGGKGEIMFPFIEGLVLSLDAAEKTIVLDEKLFGEVALYED